MRNREVWTNWRRMAGKITTDLIHYLYSEAKQTYSDEKKIFTT
jgi:hypothetical protein